MQNIIPELRGGKEITSHSSHSKRSPLPKDLQDLVNRDEADREIRSDYENSWTTTRLVCGVFLNLDSFL